MKNLKRTILSIELLILCVPAVVMLSVGLLYSPIFLLGTVSGTEEFHIGALMIFCGTWGFISLANIALHIFRNKKWHGEPVQWFGILLGFTASIIGLSNMGKTNVLLWVYVGPIIAGIHLLYLSKKYNQAS